MDNMIIENIEFKEELYQKNIKENEFSDNHINGIGDETNANN